ncbi:hypothetical protein GOP47_0013469 [Adiantum capillus-veneris]|uniref:cysteine--tRNA ligase n=1 Tax=Adiantum capillus-veneris TaxID=13818 RepID=A0A9D4UNK7_ADICA|nr:hypothetical protein GOP47_0013469 [Adiantum capillus-veneris]
MVSANGAASFDRPAQALRLHNTLSASKEPFYTQDRSRRVTWYICGPTVYDSSHLGHARNYLSFDILRRVLEGYFHYNVLYVMNVTDVDDKIINTARRNHLLSQFLETTEDPSQVLNELMKAFEEERRKQEKKVQEAKKELLNATSARQRQDLENNLKQEELKYEKLSQAFASVKQNEAVLGSVGKKEGIEMILEGGAAAVLASYLDDIGKAEVSDLAIFRAHAAKYEEEFFDDMQALGVKPPNVLSRVTEYVDAIILYIQKIVEKGFAYAARNSVYFDTKAFIGAGHTYGKLNPYAVGSLGLSSESESDFQTKDKKSNIDFALWKASKPGEPFWESPWGRGRPGWHIECSAMASDIIGSVIDIHSGGQDLMFPHHDNELAQAEAYHGCSQWVNFFLHSGHLSIEGLKMSKSLKNFITIKEALKTYTPRQLRLLFVYQAWDKPLNFSESVMKEALTKERDLQSFFKIVKNYLRKAGMDGDTYSKGLQGLQRLTDDDKKLLHALHVAESEVQERLEDNIDTGGALLALLNLASAVNSYVDKTRDDSSRAVLVRNSAEFVTKMLVIFGLSNARENEIGFGSDEATSSGNREAILAPYLDAIAQFRSEVRAAVKEDLDIKGKVMGIADRFRDYTMVDLGVRLEDRATGSDWELVDAQTLRNLRDEKIREAQEAKRKSLQSKLERKKKDLDRYEGALADPKDFLTRQKDLYSVFDLGGIPTHDAEGKELSKKARKDVEKKMKKAEDEHATIMRKLEAKEWLRGLQAITQPPNRVYRSFPKIHFCILTSEVQALETLHEASDKGNLILYFKDERCRVFAI